MLIDAVCCCVLSLGWLNAFKEGGWLPSWASPGYRNCMVGTFADVVVADALVKNVPGFDRRMAVQALIRDVRCRPCVLTVLLRRRVSFISGVVHI